MCAVVGIGWVWAWAWVWSRCGSGVGAVVGLEEPSNGAEPGETVIERVPEHKRIHNRVRVRRVGRDERIVLIDLPN